MVAIHCVHNIRISSNLCIAGMAKQNAGYSRRWDCLTFDFALITFGVLETESKHIQIAHLYDAQMK